jgi:hypothetical protein
MIASNLLAERAGFEPALPFGKRALQARALGQTTLPLRIKRPAVFPRQRAALYYKLYRLGSFQFVLCGANLSKEILPTRSLCCQTEVEVPYDE